MLLNVLSILVNVISTLSPTSRYLVKPTGLRLAFTEHQYEAAIVWSSALPLWGSNVQIRERGCSHNAEEGVWKSYGTTWIWNYRHFSRMWEVIYTALVPDILPDCDYEYTVGSGVIWNPPRLFRLRTPYDSSHPSPDDLSHQAEFLVFGDLGNGRSSVASRKLMLDLIDIRRVDGILHMGDIAYDLDTYDPGIARAYFKEMEPISSKVPYMVLPGNHEHHENFTQYRTTFRMPVNPANAGLNMYYSFDFGQAHFIMYCSDMLDLSVGEKERQRNWLKEDLSLANLHRNATPWIVALTHRPYYCQMDYQKSMDSEAPGTPGFNKDCSYRADRLKAQFEELFFNESVDLVLTGHVHNYQRATPVYHNLTMPSEFDDPHTHFNAKAPVFILSGAAGNWEGNDPNSATPQLWCRVQSRALGIGRLQVMNRTHLYWEQWDAIKKEVIDYVWIEKNRTRY